VFGEALKDIWIQGANAAEAEQREYTADEFYERIDGLSYEEVITLADPTGATAMAAIPGGIARLSARPL
jgi:hypothetical protein